MFCWNFPENQSTKIRFLELGKYKILIKKHNDIDRNQEAEFKLLQNGHFYKKEARNSSSP
jgi:hypothetical protein